MDLKRAGRDVGLINGIAVLPDGDFSVAIGDAAYDRRESLLRGRQHRGIAFQLNARKLHAIEQLAAGVNLAQFKLATERLHVALKAGANDLPPCAVAPGAIVTQAPRASVHPGFQPQPSGRRRPGVTALLGAAQAVGCPGDGHAVIPKLCIDRPRCLTIAKDLRNDQAECLAVEIKIVPCTRDKVRDIRYQSAIVQAFHIRNRINVHAQPAQVGFCQLGKKLLAIVRKHKRDRALINDLFPHITVTG